MSLRGQRYEIKTIYAIESIITIKYSLLIVYCVKVAAYQYTKSVKLRAM